MDINPEVMMKKRCAFAFSIMFWACLFLISLKFRFNQLEINLMLPDAVAWGLMAIALYRITDLTPRINTCLIIASCLTFYNFLEFMSIVSNDNQFNGISSILNPLACIWLFAVSLDLVFVWVLFGIIEDMAVVASNPIMKNKAIFRKKLYVYFGIFSLFLSLNILPFTFTLPFILLLPLIIFFLIIKMGLLNGTVYMCRDFQSNCNNDT